MIWFVLSGLAIFSGLRLLYRRYVLKTPQAVQSRGSYTLFAIFMLLFGVGALLAGIISL